MKKNNSRQNNPKVTVKLRPYLREFLICKLQDEEGFSSRKSIIGAMLEPLLESNPNGYVPQSPCQDSFTFTIPYKFNGKNCAFHTMYISEHNQRLFERMLYLYFKDVFHSYVEDKQRYMKEIKACILMFCSDYHITFNAINYESLKKSYYRYSQKKNV